MAQVPEIILTLDAELNAIERLMPPKGQVPGPEFDEHLEAIDQAQLLQLLAYAMLDGRGDLHHAMRVFSRARWVGIPLSVANAKFAALADRLDGEILKRAKYSRSAGDGLCDLPGGARRPGPAMEQRSGWKLGY